MSASASFVKYHNQRRQIHHLRTQPNEHPGRQHPIIPEGAELVERYPQRSDVPRMVGSPHPNISLHSQVGLGQLLVVSLTVNETKCTAPFIASVDQRHTFSSIYRKSLEERFDANILQGMVIPIPGNRSFITSVGYDLSRPRFISLTVTEEAALASMDNSPTFHQFIITPCPPTDHPDVHLVLGKDYLSAKRGRGQTNRAQGTPSTLLDAMMDAQPFAGHGALSPNSGSISAPSYSLTQPSYNLPGPSPGQSNFSYAATSLYSDNTGLYDWDQNLALSQGPGFGNAGIGAAGPASSSQQDSYL
ncbi:hypothetical protein GGR51DRAFT_197283 [Nemania sp. FL0031]|nr:hypothetical protein GGR51DRAFT_197283 [Nemania sp. FL0031]